MPPCPPWTPGMGAACCASRPRSPSPRRWGPSTSTWPWWCCSVSTDAETGQFGAAFRVFIVLAAVPGLLVTTAFPLLARAARDDRERLRYALQRLFDTSSCSALVRAGDRDRSAGRDRGGRGRRLRDGRRRAPRAGTRHAGVVPPRHGACPISLHLHKELLLANLSALIVSAALVLVLGSAEGARGAAWATLAGESVLAAAYLFARGRRELLPACARCRAWRSRRRRARQWCSPACPLSPRRWRA